VLVASALAQTNIYRSSQVGKTSALFTSSSNNLTISSTTATFGSAVPDTVGPGDAIQYDSDGNSSIDAICFIVSRASSTSYTVQSSSGGTPTAVTNDQDWSIYRAYTSWSNLEARTENSGIAAGVSNFDSGSTYDLDTNNQALWAVLYRGADGTAVSANAWTTSSTDRVIFYVPTTADLPVTQRNPTSVYNSTRYFALEVTTGTTSSFTVPASGPFVHMTFDGVQIKMTSATGLSGILLNTITGDAIFKNCIFVGADGGATGLAHHRGISWESTSSGTLYVYNSFFYNWNSVSNTNDAAIRIAGGTAYLYNNTAAQNAVGFQRGGGTMTCKNDVAQSNTTDFSGTCTSCEDNVSDDATAPGTGSSTSTSVTFVDEANDDYFLGSTDTGALDVGTNYSADANLPFSVDFIGTARPQPTSGGTWDRGAQEMIQANTSRRLIIP
jgi:hypothetical protein